MWTLPGSLSFPIFAYPFLPRLLLTTRFSLTSSLPTPFDWAPQILSCCLDLSPSLSTPPNSWRFHCTERAQLLHMMERKVDFPVQVFHKLEGAFILIFLSYEPDRKPIAGKGKATKHKEMVPA